MEVILDRKVFFRGLLATSELSPISPAGKGEGQRGVMSGVMCVACKSRVLISNTRLFVAASRIESTPINNEI